MDDKKVKNFNKIYRDLQKDVLKSFKKGNDKIHNVKRMCQINDFVKQIDENTALYESKNSDLFEKVFILKRVFFGRPKLNAVNNLVVWKYIKVLYNISSDKDLVSALEEDPQEVALLPGQNEMFKSLGISPDKINKLVQEMTNGKNKGIQNLINDITLQLGDSDPQEVLKALLNPATRENNDLGIDFNKMFQETHKKISSGEIDVSSIMNGLKS